jgi:hypothetical protein
MTDRNQFEAMLEALINEDQETAKEIFHNIVVAKSREIYEELLSEDFDLEEDSKDKEDDEDKEDKEDRADEAFGADDSEEEPADDGEEEPADDSEEDEVGGDATDDMIGDVTDGEEEEGSDLSDEEQTDRIMDLEDALEELKAEFEQLMAGEEGEPEMGADDMGMDAAPEMDGGMDGGMDDMGMEKPVDELQRFMEYVDKVALPKHGDNGTNTKSIVAGKNDMGGTTANIAKSFSTEKGGTQGGLAKPNATVNDAGNINKPGGNAGKTAFKKKEPGHGAEKKGSGESADIKSSLIGSRK